jgi:hypothetical protein
MLTLVTDNAADYSQDSGVMQYLMGKYLFRDKMLVKLNHESHSPGSSARNYHIEGTWPQPRQKLLGKELGRSVANSREQLFAMYRVSRKGV